MKKLALVTGASSGIGRELACIHAESGHDVIIVARRENKLIELKEQLEKQFGCKVYVFATDLTSKEELENLYSQVDNLKRPLHFLINNAGFGDFGEFLSSDIKLQEDMIELNITALTKITRHFLPGLVETKGKILNIASVAAFQPGPMMSVYFATKAYVLSFSEALYQELKLKGVTVTTLCPGPTESGFMDYSGMGESKLVKGLTLSTSKTVAKYGYKAMMNGNSVVVHGVRNRLLIFFIRFLPRKLVASLALRLMK